MKTLQEQIDVFGRSAVCETIEQMIRSYQADLEFLATQNDFIFKDYLGSMEPSFDWIFKLRLEKNKEAERRLNKMLKKWEIKLKIANGKLKESDVLVDLDVIKLIPIEQFLSEPTLRGHNKLHYKAPWRPDEKKGSLVVFTLDNRFYDFGDPDKKGTVIDFIMLTEGLEFMEAVNYLKNYL